MKGPESFIFTTIVRLLFFVINLFALYLLLRGHDRPGGGFIAGLASAISLVLLSLGVGLQEMHRLLRLDLVRLAAAGLLLAALTSVAPVLAGRPFLEHFHVNIHSVPLIGDLHAGTPLAFDIGVYLVVVGVTAKMVLVLAKSTEGLQALVRVETAHYSSIRETPIEEQPAEEVPARPESTDNAGAN